ncbi:PH domain-containing protein [Opitutus sp. GAS368]|uniref:PH domain-containing protein n=1 Tax=Opitutus sp. GAS368 TaxID=1882749 RepID=UPI00087BA6E4|nr:PH domain-containing protein [Opitutus sp. GAS368]SDS39835.1 PH domain-containing protein [Opitutus sp. GAS368]
MYNRYSTFVLRWLKVPPEPHAPQGDPASLRVFRAGKNFYRLRLFAWSVTQVLAFAGIVFWAFVFVSVEETARIEKARRAATARAVAGHPATLVEQADQALTALKATQQTGLKPAAPAAPNAAKKPVRRRVRVGGWDGFLQVFVELAIMLPPWAFPILWALKILGLTLYLLQLPLTYAIRRLDFEMRWYMVTDRSLRIRTGVARVQEITMSFANLQQVEVSQGPLQRVLGLADLKVQSAGGGDVAPGRQRHEDSLHIGYFHGVDNAHEIRDLIQERLRRFRDSGLGDPEEMQRAALAAVHVAPVETASSTDADVLAAARELAAEARALRVALN